MAPGSMAATLMSCLVEIPSQTARMRRWIPCLLFLFWATAWSGEDPRVQREKIWNEQISPIMKASCVECHGEKKMKARIRVDSFEGTVQGGRRPGVVWGHPEASRIYRVITRPRGTEGAMPPGKRDPLTEEQIAKIKDWIMTGPAEELPAPPPARPEAPSSGPK